MFKSVRLLIVLLFLGIPIFIHAQTRLAHPVPDSMSLVSENYNLTAGEFFAAYTSKNITERRYAQMYLVGVLDSTEGIAWCDYYHFKTISLKDMVYAGLLEANSKQLQQRAATFITDILHRTLYCRNNKRK